MLVNLIHCCDHIHRLGDSVTRIHSSIDNKVHIEPNGSHDPCTTFCGDVDRMEATDTDTNKKVSCRACQIEFEILRHGLKIVLV